MEQATKRSRRRVLLLASAVFWILGAFEATQACMVCGNDGSGDGKTAPGLVCQVEVRDKNHNWGYTEIGQVCNYDTREEVMVVCPLLRDSWSSTNGLECAAATLVRHGVPSIYGSEYPPATCGLDDVRQWPCILQSKDATGYTGWWTGWKPIGADGIPPFNFAYDVPTGRFMQDWRHHRQARLRAFELTTRDAHHVYPQGVFEMRLVKEKLLGPGDLSVVPMHGPNIHEISDAQSNFQFIDLLRSTIPMATRGGYRSRIV